MTLWMVAALSGCQLTSHAVQSSTMGLPSSSREMLKVLDAPGPLTVETVNSADWQVPLSGLLNLNHEKARAAKLKDRSEPISVFFHVVRHPTRGTFIVDTGVEKALRDAPERSAFAGPVSWVMHLELLKVQVPLADWVAQQQRLDGVFLTHLHLDHVSGMPDVPHGTPIFSGPHKASGMAFHNIALRPAMDRAFAGQAPISELQFRPDPQGRFAGVVDVFGDGSFWAILVPGHTEGSLAFVARTASGPVLMTGDTSHTVWGWENEVEPGSYTADAHRNQVALKQLRKLIAEHPGVVVKLGHQILPENHKTAAR